MAYCLVSSKLLDVDYTLTLLGCNIRGLWNRSHSICPFGRLLSNDAILMRSNRPDLERCLVHWTRPVAITGALGSSHDPHALLRLEFRGFGFGFKRKRPERSPIRRVVLLVGCIPLARNARWPRTAHRLCLADQYQSCLVAHAGFETVFPARERGFLVLQAECVDDYETTRARI